MKVNTDQTWTVDDMIGKYVRLRDQKRQVEEKHKEELKRYNDVLSGIEAWLMEQMNRLGLDNMKTPHGTAFKSVRRSATVYEWAVTLPWIIANQAWHLLEARVSKTAAFDTVNETKEPIPGVELNTEVCLNIRRAGEKAPRTANSKE